MPCNSRKTAGPQHEIVQVFVDGQKVKGREDQRQQSHAAERDIGHQKDARETDGFASKRAAAACQILQEAAAIAHPVEVLFGWRKFRDDVERQFGKDRSHAFDQARVEFIGARCECDFDLWQSGSLAIITAVRRGWRLLQSPKP